MISLKFVDSVVDPIYGFCDWGKHAYLKSDDIDFINDCYHICDDCLKDEYRKEEKK